MGRSADPPEERIPSRDRVPLTGLTVDTDELSGEEALLGLSVTDLQEDIVIGDDGITGTLKSVTDYTGFSGDVDEQSGHYIALHITSDVEGATIMGRVVGGVHGAVEVYGEHNADGICIFRITSTTQAIEFVASADGHTTVTKVYALTDLTLEE